MTPPIVAAVLGLTLTMAPGTAGVDSFCGTPRAMAWRPGTRTARGPDLGYLSLAAIAFGLAWGVIRAAATLRQA